MEQMMALAKLSSETEGGLSDDESDNTGMLVAIIVVVIIIIAIIIVAVVLCIRKQGKKNSVTFLDTN